LDKKTLAETIDAEFEGIKYKDCLIKHESAEKIINIEKLGPNYFLIGGPYENYT
jgi:hypothetical protein